MKTKLNLLVKEMDTKEMKSIYITNTEMYMPPRITETIIHQGDTYNVIDVIHNYDKHTIEIILIDTTLW